MGAGTREAERLADEQEKTRVVSVIVMGRSVCIWNKKGDIIKSFAINAALRRNVTAYLRERDLSVNNADSFDGWLDELKAVE